MSVEVTLVDHYQVEDEAGHVFCEGGTRQTGKEGVVTFMCDSPNHRAAIEALSNPALKQEAIKIAGERGWGPCGIGMPQSPYPVDQYRRPLTHGNAAIAAYMIDISVIQRLV